MSTSVLLFLFVDSTTSENTLLSFLLTPALLAASVVGLLKILLQKIVGHFLIKETSLNIQISPPNLKVLCHEYLQSVFVIGHCLIEAILLKVQISPPNQQVLSHEHLQSILEILAHYLVIACLQAHLVSLVQVHLVTML